MGSFILFRRSIFTSCLNCAQAFYCRQFFGLFCFIYPCVIRILNTAQCPVVVVVVVAAAAAAAAAAVVVVVVVVVVEVLLVVELVVVVFPSQNVQNKQELPEYQQCQ